tara:strand:- start:1776 stop:2450 length:675 start_codon:yes stop_codon:yes gene_type:complete
LDDGTYQSIFKYIDSANIACGGHAGDTEMMKRMVDLSIENNVKIGAHPSYPDKTNFGRIRAEIEHNELFDAICNQIQSLVDIASKNNISFVKPHGALYNESVNDSDLSQIIVDAILSFDANLAVVGLAGSKLIETSKKNKLSTLLEAFADRTYNSDGTLKDRKYSDSLIIDPKKAANQAYAISKGYVESYENKIVDIEAETICIHSDTPNAVAIARAVKQKMHQ